MLQFERISGGLLSPQLMVQLAARLHALALEGYFGKEWQQPDVAAAPSVPVPSVLPPGGFGRVAERPVDVCPRRAALLRRMVALLSG
jgi:hypothetical protein